MDVVRDIFTLFIGGMGAAEIAKLNEDCCHPENIRKARDSLIIWQTVVDR